MLQNPHGAGSPPGAALARQLKETDLLLRRFDDQLAALRHNALSQADRLALISRITVFPSRALRMKLLTVAELLQGEQAP